MDGDNSGTADCDKGAFELGQRRCGIQAASEPADYLFFGGPDTVTIRVRDDGTDLDCLMVTAFAVDHPNATTVQQTGKYWTIEPQELSNFVAAASSNPDQHLEAAYSKPTALLARPAEATPDYLVDLTLPYAAADAANTVCRYEGGMAWDCAAGSFVANSSVTRNDIDQLSDWAVGDQAVPPTAVILVSFSADVETSGQVSLAWRTASEVALTGFLVERSGGAGDAAWLPVTPLIAAQGSAATGAAYRWRDTPGVGTYSYRLRVVNANGKSDTHGPLQVEIRHLRVFLPLVWQQAKPRLR